MTTEETLNQAAPLQILTEGLKAYHEVFSANTIQGTRQQMLHLLNLEVFLSQMIEALKAVERMSREDLVDILRPTTEGDGVAAT